MVTRARRPPLSILCCFQLLVRFFFPVAVSLASFSRTSSLRESENCLFRKTLSYNSYCLSTATTSHPTNAGVQVRESEQQTRSAAAFTQHISTTHSLAAAILATYRYLLASSGTCCLTVAASLPAPWSVEATVGGPGLLQSATSSPFGRFVCCVFGSERVRPCLKPHSVRTLRPPQL